MDITEGKMIICKFMHEIVEERRELSKLYFDLKLKLDHVEKEVSNKSFSKNRLIIIIQKAHGDYWQYKCISSERGCSR